METLLNIAQNKSYRIDGKNSNGQWVLRCFAPASDHAYVISNYQKKKFESGQNISVRKRQYVTSKSPLLYDTI